MKFRLVESRLVQLAILTPPSSGQMQKIPTGGLLISMYETTETEKCVTHSQFGVNYFACATIFVLDGPLRCFVTVVIEQQLEMNQDRKLQAFIVRDKTLLCSGKTAKYLNALFICSLSWHVEFN